MKGLERFASGLIEYNRAENVKHLQCSELDRDSD